MWNGVKTIRADQVLFCDFSPSHLAWRKVAEQNLIRSFPTFISIPIGKCSLYVAAGGFSPEKTLPITIDLGTNNQKV